MRSFPRRYREALFGFTDVTDEDPDAVVRRRPDPSTWSALEYTAHVRDMLDWMAGTIRRMNREREPTVDAFDPDERALDDRYNEQDPPACSTAWGRPPTAWSSPYATSTRATGPGSATSPGAPATCSRWRATRCTRDAHHLRDVDRVLHAVVGHPPSST